MGESSANNMLSKRAKPYPSRTPQKRGRRKAGPSPIQSHYSQLLYGDHPFVTTGGGVVAQPATLKSVSTAARAKAAFFMESSPLVMTC